MLLHTLWGVGVSCNFSPDEFNIQSEAYNKVRNAQTMQNRNYIVLFWKYGLNGFCCFLWDRMIQLKFNKKSLIKLFYTLSPISDQIKNISKALTPGLNPTIQQLNSFYICILQIILIKLGTHLLKMKNKRADFNRAIHRNNINILEDTSQTTQIRAIVTIWRKLFKPPWKRIYCHKNMHNSWHCILPMEV